MVQLTANNPFLTMRLKFKKVGSLQYISHLDLVRTMHKIIVRSKLPLWYTEGFNPKPKMIFAAPLSIGTESECEFLDIRLIDDISPEEVKARLNANMTSEMQVLDAYYADTPLTDLKWFAYDIRITTVGASVELAESCERTLLADRVEVEKKKKSGEYALVDIRPLIRSAKVELVGEELVIRAELSADQSAFLNPEYVIKALTEKLGILSCGDLVQEYYSVMRLGAYRDDMTEFR